MPAALDGIFPAFVTDALRYALPLFGRQLHGFDLPDALLSAPETRSSSPVRILRDERRESAVRGLYPLGEGAGYAGGIISSAVDGLKAALDERTARMIRAALFDMDGLLFDSERLYFKAVPAIARELGYPMDDAFFLRTLGVSNRECRKLYEETFGAGFPFDKAAEMLFSFILDYNRKQTMPLKEGAMACLTALHRRGMPLVLATSSPRFVVEGLFASLPALDALLTGKVCGDDVAAGKPGPEIYLKGRRAGGVCARGMHRG